MIGYSLEANTEPNNFQALKLDEKITHIVADIRDIKALEKVMDEHKPEIIFHLAAQALVRDSYAEPVYTMEANVMGTVNVLEMMRQKEYVK